MRHWLYAFIDPDEDGKSIYDYLMMVVIVVSLIPLTFKEETPLLEAVNRVSTVIYIADYLLRWVTADYKQGKGPISFVLYPFTIMAIMDLLAILPSFGALDEGFRVLKVFRLFRAFRALRVFRALKMFRYSRSITIITQVMKRQSAPLMAVGTLALAYVLISALVIFNVEPDTFDTFFDAIYWATISLTTVGYGDIYPVSDAGRIITMLSSFIGIAVVALPSGIITAGYMDEISKSGKSEQN